MSAQLSLKIEPDVEKLDSVYDQVSEFGESESWPQAITYQVNLVIEELAINAINYGGCEGTVDIVISSSAEEIKIEFSDPGSPFDPLTESKVPDIDLDVGDRPIGGLGVHLIRTMMDNAVYSHEDGRNRLILIKRREKS